jgi:hypothetical protein
MGHSGGYNFEACSFKAGVDLTNDVFSNSVRLDDRECAFDGNVESPQFYFKK